MGKALNRNSGAEEFHCDKSATVAWKIKLSSEDITILRQIAEEMGKDRLIPKPTVTALLHKAIHFYIAAWEESLRAPSAINGMKLVSFSDLHA